MHAPLAIFDSGAATHVGKVRQRNEDSYLVRPEAGIWAVADGMGGHEAGDVASSTVIEALKSVDAPTSASELVARCEDHIVSANSKLQKISHERGGIVMGTTIAALLAYDSYYACLWSGDSRVYLVRAGEISPVSRDHTAVQELVAEGALTPDEASTWPGRNVITRAVGVHDDPELELENGVLHPGDAFVLCSDGLTAHVSDREIRDHVLAGVSQEACDALIALTLERGAVDNVTAIVVRYRPDGASASPGSSKGIWD